MPWWPRSLPSQRPLPSRPPAIASPISCPEPRDMSVTRIDQAHRVIKASRPTIFAAMTNAEALVAWLPPMGMSVEMLDFDPQPGGHYIMVLRDDDAAIAGKSGGNEDIVTVRYLDLVPDSLVSQAVDFVSEDPRFAGT